MTALLRPILKRLVRIAVGCGISYQHFAHILKSAYFEVGSTFEPLKGKPNTDSRISLLTGLSRREVRSLREQSPEPDVKPSLERLVLDAWSSNPDFLDEAGGMLPLERTMRQGGARSFEALVTGVSSDLRARSILDEWLRKGFVFLDDEDKVHVAGTGLGFGTEGAEGAAVFIGELACDLLSGFEQVYLLGRPIPGFSYHVVYGHRLTEESVLLICSQALREGTEVANRLNRLVVEREALDAGHPSAHQRVSFGFGSYQVDGRLDPGLLSSPSKP